MNKFISKFKTHFKWTFHNIVPHRFCEILHLFETSELSENIHHFTIPKENLKENLDSVMNPERDD